jgi:protein TonB
MKHSTLILFAILTICQFNSIAQETHCHKEVMHFTSVEHLPVYPDGWDGLFNLIKSEVEIPANQIQNNTDNRVFVSFIIDKNGKANEFKVEQSVTKIVDDAVIKAFKQMKDWKPAQDHGHIVEVKMILPYKVDL